MWYEKKKRKKVKKKGKKEKNEGSTGCDVTESDVIIPKVDDSPWV
jgi:hypothetical protein